jgi:hypothetical protein
VIAATWLGPAIVIVGCAASLALIVSGALRLWRASSRFGERLAKYDDLPLQREASDAQASVTRLDARLSEIPGLIERARNLVGALQKSRRQVQVVASSINFAAQLIRAVVEGPERSRKPKPEPRPNE